MSSPRKRCERLAAEFLKLYLNNISLYYYKNNFQSIYPTGLYIVYVRLLLLNMKNALWRSLISGFLSNI